MIDLSGVARHLRLSVDQLRVVADLLQQGYQPGFIERYRADETGNLPRATLWLLKHEIDRQMRLQAARQKASSQLPKDAQLDAEAVKFLERATTEVEIEAALRAFRSRRQLSQNQESDKLSSQLLEKLIEYQGPAIDDLPAWAAEQLNIDAEAAKVALQHAGRLVGMLMHSDTGLNENLRRTIQRRAMVRVELCDPAHSEAADENSSTDDSAEVASGEFASGESAAEDALPDLGDHPASATIVVAPPAADTAIDTLEVAAAESAEPAAPAESTSGANDATAASLSIEIVLSAAAEAQAGDLPTSTSEAIVSSQAAGNEAAGNEAAGETVGSTSSSIDTLGGGTTSGEAATSAVATTNATVGGEAVASQADGSEAAGVATQTEKRVAKGGSKKKKDKSKETKPVKKPVAKMTPRQRRRRWLIAMLQPLKSLKSPLTKLSSYQQLMLGRGRRSQLVKTELQYDHRALVALARDTFVTDKHPLAAWFSQSAEEALEHSLRSRMEADAVNDLEEIAAQRLLENSVDQLRQSLLQRPVRGHCILVIDAVGPKAAAVAIIDPSGKVLAIDEIPCSASPGIVTQNVTRLGELVHQYRVTLVALTNGPARRFLVLSLRELVKQSATSGLRWTMADRSGADAYAVSRSALKELSIHNRRHRAAIWVGRSLQDPLNELLKVDVNRLRLGSFQRELPQEPLKQLVRETIADCVYQQGIDTLSASVDQLTCVPGVSPSHAQQIASMSQAGTLTSRKDLLASLSDWSEMDSRQAIGVLRIYGSEQPLDATTIHPDDYRLAQRLIENTELALPPAAPEGWTRPQANTPTAPGVANAVTEDSGATKDSGVPPEASGATGDAADSQTSADQSAAAAETSPAETSAQEERGPTTEAIAETAAAASGSSEAEAISASSETAAVEPAAATESGATQEPPAEATTTAEANPAAAGDTPEGAITSWPTKAAAPAPTWPKPEYPEDIVDIPTTPPNVDVEKLARSWQVGREKLRQVASCLHAPFADPRLAHPPVPLMTEMPTLGNLQPGMCVWAVVIGVADFGAFVELAPDCSGLIHISRLSPNYIEDPHQCVQVGDLVMAWVVSVDEKKNRVALTALSPAQRAEAEAAAAERKAEQEEHRRRDRGGPPAGGRGQQTVAAGGQTAARSGGGQSRSSGGEGRRGGGGGGGGQGRGGQQSAGRGRGRPTHNKTVVVTSKKPKANITDAMKEGEEPLRSFSDLMQFYQAKRTDDTPAAKPPAAPETPSSGETSAG